MIGFDELQPSQWLMDGIFTRRGTGRGLVKAVRSPLGKLVTGVALAVVIFTETGGVYAAMDRVQTTSYVANARVDERDRVDPAVWGPLIAHLKAIPLVAESDLDEPPTII